MHASEDDPVALLSSGNGSLTMGDGMSLYMMLCLQHLQFKVPQVLCLDTPSESLL